MGLAVQLMPMGIPGVSPARSVRSMLFIRMEPSASVLRCIGRMMIGSLTVGWKFYSDADNGHKKIPTDSDNGQTYATFCRDRRLSTVNAGLGGFLLISSCHGHHRCQVSLALDVLHVKLTRSKQLTIEAFQGIIKMS